MQQFSAPISSQQHSVRFDTFPSASRPAPSAFEQPYANELLLHGGAPLQNQFDSYSHPQSAYEFDASPPSDVTDTPGTLYPVSPSTVAGDVEVGNDSDDEDAVVRSRYRSGDLEPDKDKGIHLTSFGLYPSPATSPTTYTLGDLDNDDKHVDEGQLRLFKTQLQNDIKTVALFPSKETSPVVTRHRSPSFPSMHSQQDAQQEESQTQSSQSTADVTTAPSSQSLSLQLHPLRKQSMHLHTPSRPIDPFERRQIANPPTRPIQAIMIDRNYLCRFRSQRPPEPTVTMKDLILPKAEFHCGFDPEVMAAETTSPENYELDIMAHEYEDDGLFGEQAHRFMVYERPYVVSQDSSSPSYVEDSPARSVETRSSKRKAVSPILDVADSDSSDDDDEEEFLAADDDDYKAPPSARSNYVASSDLPNKRARLSSSGAAVRYSASPAPQEYSQSSSTAPSSPGPRRVPPPQAVTKPRTRHLQPNLVRTNGCLHGCTLMFSTAYESRRHQEDAHGREEAYALIAASQASKSQPPTVLPRDYRFLIQIGLHCPTEKWDSRVRNSLQNGVKNEDEPLEDHAAQVLIKFAREWSKRYECPRCGTSFSRLDSKKRHFEKQCR